VQYAHARVASVFNHARERGVAVPTAWTEADLALLEAPEELTLVKTLLRFPPTIAGAAQACEPHRIAVYLYELAAQLHAYHHLGTHTPTFRIVRPEEPASTRARLGLARAVALVLRSGLGLLGIVAPESM
jgi:arginyl-tRNA synthetase